MKKADAIKHFGTRIRIAEVLGISPASISGWGELVPEKNAARLAAASDGALVYEPRVYDAYRSRKPAIPEPAEAEA